MRLTREAVNRIKGIAIVPVGLTAALVLFSIVLNWNAITVISYFFIVAPALAIYLPRFVSEKSSLVFKSVSGLIIFYGLMVFMIYDHYESDYFQVMIVGLVANILVVLINGHLRAVHVQAH